jgi:hypothetical protein
VRGGGDLTPEGEESVGYVSLYDHKSGVTSQALKSQEYQKAGWKSRLA